MALGITFAVVSANLKSASADYESSCSASEAECSIKIKIEEDMEAPIYFYYSLENFFQNHFDYIGSLNYDQLKGNVKTVEELESCNPIVKVGDLGYNITNLEGGKLDSNDPLFPCGLIAATFFNGKQLSPLVS